MTAPVESRGYVHGDVLVSTDWVATHLSDPPSASSNPTRTCCSTRPGTSGRRAGGLDAGPHDQLRRDYLSRAEFESLAARIGITPGTTVVFYGDKNNWWACYAFWVFQLFGHTQARVMDGGRLKWEQEGRR